MDKTGERAFGAPGNQLSWIFHVVFLRMNLWQHQTLTGEDSASVRERARQVLTALDRPTRPSKTDCYENGRIGAYIPRIHMIQKILLQENHKTLSLHLLIKASNPTHMLPRR